MKKIFYTLPITVLLLLTACNQTSVEKVSGEERSSSTKTDEAYQLGDTLKIDDVIIKITEAKQTDPIQFTKSKKGKIVTIDVDVRNNSKDPILTVTISLSFQKVKKQSVIMVMKNCLYQKNLTAENKQMENYILM